MKVRQPLIFSQADAGQLLAALDDILATTPMTPDEEFDFYAQPENQEPQGPARRRHASRLGPPVPVRSLPSHWNRPAGQPTLMIDRYLHGSAGLLSTSYAEPPDVPAEPCDHDDAAVDSHGCEVTVDTDGYAYRS